MNTLFRTTSLSLASAINIASQAPLYSIDFPNGSHRAEFVFDTENDPQFQDLISQFWARQLMVDANSYFESLRYLKSRLYELKHDR